MVDASHGFSLWFFWIYLGKPSHSPLISMGQLLNVNLTHTIQAIHLGGGNGPLINGISGGGNSPPR